MRRPVDRLAVLLAVSLAIGCTPEPPTPSSPVASRPDAVPRPAAEKSPKLVPRKKEKEPGLGRAMPRASFGAQSAR